VLFPCFEVVFLPEVIQLLKQDTLLGFGGICYVVILFIVFILGNFVMVIYFFLALDYFTILVYF